MTNETQNTNTPDNNGKSKLPTHHATTRTGHGKQATFERIGVAWENDDSSFYVKLHGTQVVSQFTLYPNKSEQAGS